MAERVLILGDDLRAFLAIARSLGRQGLEIHAAPSDFAAPALSSRYVSAVHSLPAYGSGAEAWEAALSALIEAEDIRTVVPCGDSGLVRLVHHAEALGPGRLAVPNWEAFEAFTDKERTRTLAKGLGVPVADGRGVEPIDSAAWLVARFGLPLLLKPRRSYRIGDRTEKRVARLIATETELGRAMLRGEAEDCIVESFFPGFGVGVSVLARRGEILLAYQHRRLRQGSATGVSTSRISEGVNPVLGAEVAALVRATGLDGVAMFEFRVHPRSARHVLLEVNPRFWGSLPLAIAAGADFPALLYRLRSGASIEPAGYRTGVVRHDLTGEYERCVLALETAGSALARLGNAAAAVGTSLFCRAGRCDSWTPDDPGPWAAEKAELRARLFEAVRKRLLGSAKRAAGAAVPLPRGA